MNIRVHALESKEVGNISYLHKDNLWRVMRIPSFHVLLMTRPPGSPDASKVALRYNSQPCGTLPPSRREHPLVRVRVSHARYSSTRWWPYLRHLVWCDMHSLFNLYSLGVAFFHLLNRSPALMCHTRKFSKHTILTCRMGQQYHTPGQ